MPVVPHKARWALEFGIRGGRWTDGLTDREEMGWCRVGALPNNQRFQVS